MVKLSFVLVSFGLLLLAVPQKAEPDVVQQVADGFHKIFSAVAAVAEDIRDGKGREKFQQIKDLIVGFLSNSGDRSARQKRAIHTMMSMTKGNQTHYQQVVMAKSWDKDHEKYMGWKKAQAMDTNCLVKNNEVYYLDYMVSIMIKVLEEMQKTIRGKAIAVKMNGDRYNQVRYNSSAKAVQH
ncbi:uncharacterized protein LOC129749150 [Uranotaenia lowii]|uniref:uncharacterized protein LOC129749150 n=1 Tax=Uranotaenia lowii TaxID=190385 RepID=UPI00247A8BEA|nr:uncharacterized protein LOC129749150 [Uranotaenia lowii]